MKLKILALLILIVFIAGLAAACTDDTGVLIGGQELSFLKVAFSETYAEVTPSQPGNIIITVQFLAKGEDPDLSAISEAFFGAKPCVISNGTDTYACKSIAFENADGKIRVLPIFEVPETLKDATSLTLSGSSFPSIELNI